MDIQKVKRRIYQLSQELKVAKKTYDQGNKKKEETKNILERSNKDLSFWEHLTLDRRKIWYLLTLNDDDPYITEKEIAYKKSKEANKKSISNAEETLSTVEKLKKEICNIVCDHPSLPDQKVRDIEKIQHEMNAFFNKMKEYSDNLAPLKSHRNNATVIELVETRVKWWIWRILLVWYSSWKNKTLIDALNEALRRRRYAREKEPERNENRQEWATFNNTLDALEDKYGNTSNMIDLAADISWASNIFSRLLIGRNVKLWTVITSLIEEYEKANNAHIKHYNRLIDIKREHILENIVPKITGEKI